MVKGDDNRNIISIKLHDRLILFIVFFLLYEFYTWNIKKKVLFLLHNKSRDRFKETRNTNLCRCLNRMTYFFLFLLECLAVWYCVDLLIVKDWMYFVLVYCNIVNENSKIKGHESTGILWELQKY